MKNRFNRLDGKHKLAVIGAIVCWVLSMWFSYLGFKLENEQLQWVGWIMAGIVTVVELVFNSSPKKLPLTLFVTGALCYGYGIWTNVTGFWSIQNPDVAFTAFSMKSFMSWFIGSILEILPEPLFMWGIMSAIDGDFLGNIVGWWRGDFELASPDDSPVSATQKRYNIDNMPESIRRIKSPTSNPEIIPNRIPKRASNEQLFGGSLLAKKQRGNDE